MPTVVQKRYRFGFYIFNSFLAGAEFCHLLIKLFFGPEIIGPDLDPNR